MQDVKFYLHSKRFWGFVASIMGFIAIQSAQYFGHDVGQYVHFVGTIFDGLGIPFTFYSGVVADKPLGFTK